MRGRYTALAILALAGGTAGGITLERFYLNPANMGGRMGQKSFIGSPRWTRISGSQDRENRPWGWI